MLNDQEIEHLFHRLRSDWGGGEEDIPTKELHDSLMPEALRDLSDYFNIDVVRLRKMSGNEMRLLELEYSAYGDKECTFEEEQAAEDLGSKFAEGVERCGGILAYLEERKREKQKKKEVDSPRLPRQKYR